MSSFIGRQEPTLNRKVCIAADWTLALCFPRDLVALGRLHDPRAALVDAAGRGLASDRSA